MYAITIKIANAYKDKNARMFYNRSLQNILFLNSMFLRLGPRRFVNAEQTTLMSLAYLNIGIGITDVEVLKSLFLRITFSTRHAFATCLVAFTSREVI